MARKQKRFVPRLLFTAACAARVVPSCAVEGCGGKERHTSGPDAGAGGSGVGGSVLGMAGGAFSVGVQAFGGVHAMAGGAFSVGVQAFGGALQRGGAGGRSTGGIGGVATGGFGVHGMAGGAFGVANVGFGGTFRDSGADSAPSTPDAGAADGSDGHAALDRPEDERCGKVALDAAKRRPGSRRRST